MSLLSSSPAKATSRTFTIEETLCNSVRAVRHPSLAALWLLETARHSERTARQELCQATRQKGGRTVQQATEFSGDAQSISTPLVVSSTTHWSPVKVVTPACCSVREGFDSLAPATGSTRVVPTASKIRHAAIACRANHTMNDAPTRTARHTSKLDIRSVDQGSWPRPSGETTRPLSIFSVSQTCPCFA